MALAVSKAVDDVVAIVVAEVMIFGLTVKLDSSDVVTLATQPASVRCRVIFGALLKTRPNPIHAPRTTATMLPMPAP